MAKVVSVLLPLMLKSDFDYLLPQHLEPIAQIGKRVTVPLGKNKILTGIITAIKEQSEIRVKYQLKSVVEILDQTAVVSLPLIQLYQWVAHYYLCSAGEVLKASLPANLKVENEWYAEWITHTRLDQPLTDKEYLILEALQIQHKIPITEIEEIADTGAVLPILQRMADKGLIMLNQKVAGSYVPKHEKHVKILPPFNTSEGLKEAFALTKNAPKQEEVLLYLSQFINNGNFPAQKEIFERINTTTAVIQALRQKGIVDYEYIEIDRLSDFGFHHTRKTINLNTEQQQAVAVIEDEFKSESPRPILLHGVTGSGKTYVYIELIKKVLAQGKQVLYLLPEIGLTKQVIDKVKSELGDVVGVYHSKFSDNERVEIWLRLLKKDFRVIIGVRSAILLPFEDLGLIIVDEEHDASFKQSEPAPRYHARDLAVWYSHFFKVPLVLGSATPSVESYFNALNGKYRLVEITQRAIQAQLPKIELINMRIQLENKLTHGLLSQPLMDAIRETVERNEQVILFNHRRAYSYYLQCEHCGHVPKCLYCDISLSFHKQDNLLRCHYCGYSDHKTEICPVCRHTSLRRQGIGTERLEEQLAEIFPKYRIARMDLDTTRAKNAINKIIHQFEKGAIDILVGTQMVTKGLDFANATLAAVVQADKLLNFPDFRSHENTYQLLTQFAGRPGRGEKAGKVLIQTLNPEHPVLNLLNHPYKEFYELEVNSRLVPAYPPYSRLIAIELQHQEQHFLEQEGKSFGTILIHFFKGFMLGPEYPMIARVRNHYRLQILIKIRSNISIKWIKETIQESIDHYYEKAPNKTIRFIINVDPR